MDLNQLLIITLNVNGLSITKKTEIIRFGVIGKIQI